MFTARHDVFFQWLAEFWYLEVCGLPTPAAAVVAVSSLPAVSSREDIFIMEERHHMAAFGGESRRAGG